MSTHVARLLWERGEQAFVDARYSRRHELRFDGGAVIAASSAPTSVPLPFSDASAVDPEEAFVAALSSCHMLWFLALACKRGFCIDRYEDDAEGELGTNPEGRRAMTRVTLRPRVVFSGARMPDASGLAALHHEAHEACYIANSVRTEVVVEPA